MTTLLTTCHGKAGSVSKPEKRWFSSATNYTAGIETHMGIDYVVSVYKVSFDNATPSGFYKTWQSDFLYSFHPFRVDIALT